MQTIHLLNPNIPPALLLMEPDTLGDSARAAQLRNASFCVTRAATPQELYGLRSVLSFSVAVVSDTVGTLALRASAQIVRGQWPSARILILGQAPRQFEDHLYDETVSHNCDERTLLATISRVSEAPCAPRDERWVASSQYGSVASRIPGSGGLEESDPSKKPGPVKTMDNARNWPADELFRPSLRRG